MRLELYTESAEATRAVGEAVAQVLRPGDVVALGGELGAGKTQFVKGAVKGLGSTDPVVSPTFTLIREYSGRFPIHHVDVYRLERLQDVIDLGFEELSDEGAVVFVEWGDAIEALLPEAHLSVDLTAPGGDDLRLLVVIGEGSAWAGRWERLEGLLERWTGGAP